MTNQEILTKAIPKATKGGYTKLGDRIIRVRLYSADRLEIIYERDRPERVPAKISGYYSVREIILDQGFAKALWGHETVCGAIDGEKKTFWAAWKIHLMRMAIAPDPIKYLGEHLDDC